MPLNVWSDKEVKRAESTWGQKLPQYSLDMYNFAIEGVNSWLDLGCGFGRFLNYLLTIDEDPNYIGYDGSPDMIARISERFPIYASRVFVHDITKPILNAQESVVCSAVLIHITAAEQLKVLTNIKTINPKKAAFDINCPAESIMKIKPYFEKVIKGAEGTFRMTWQSYYEFTNLVSKIFDGYKAEIKSYDLKQGRNKVLYMLERL